MVPSWSFSETESQATWFESHFWRSLLLVFACTIFCKTNVTLCLMRLSRSRGTLTFSLILPYKGCRATSLSAFHLLAPQGVSVAGFELLPFSWPLVSSFLLLSNSTSRTYLETPRFCPWPCLARSCSLRTVSPLSGFTGTGWSAEFLEENLESLVLFPVPRGPSVHVSVLALPCLLLCLPAFPSWKDHCAWQSWKEGSSLCWDSFQALKSLPPFVTLPGLRSCER